jgi:hypothetical protein
MPWFAAGMIYMRCHTIHVTLGSEASAAPA